MFARSQVTLLPEAARRDVNDDDIYMCVCKNANKKTIIQLISTARAGRQKGLSLPSTSFHTQCHAGNRGTVGEEESTAFHLFSPPDMVSGFLRPLISSCRVSPKLTHFHTKSHTQTESERKRTYTRTHGFAHRIHTCFRSSSRQ